MSTYQKKIVQQLIEFLDPQFTGMATKKHSSSSYQKEPSGEQRAPSHLKPLDEPAVKEEVNSYNLYLAPHNTFILPDSEFGTISAQMLEDFMKRAYGNILIEIDSAGLLGMAQKSAGGKCTKDLKIEHFTDRLMNPKIDTLDKVLKYIGIHIQKFQEEQLSQSKKDGEIISDKTFIVTLDVKKADGRKAPCTELVTELVKQFKKTPQINLRVNTKITRDEDDDSSEYNIITKTNKNCKTPIENLKTYNPNPKDTILGLIQKCKVTYPAFDLCSKLPFHIMTRTAFLTEKKRFDKLKFKLNESFQPNMKVLIILNGTFQNHEFASEFRNTKDLLQIKITTPNVKKIHICAPTLETIDISSTKKVIKLMPKLFPGIYKNIHDHFKIFVFEDQGGFCHGLKIFGDNNFGWSTLDGETLPFVCTNLENNKFVISKLP